MGYTQCISPLMLDNLYDFSKKKKKREKCFYPILFFLTKTIEMCNCYTYLFVLNGTPLVKTWVRILRKFLYANI